MNEHEFILTLYSIMTPLKYHVFGLNIFYLINHFYIGTISKK